MLFLCFRQIIQKIATQCLHYMIKLRIYKDSFLTRVLVFCLKVSYIYLASWLFKRKSGSAQIW